MDVVSFIEAGAIEWIGRQQSRYRPLAAPLSDRLRSEFEGCFPDELLDSVRVLTVASIENPDFFERVASIGFPIPFDFRRVDGITFGDDPRHGFFKGRVFHHPEMAFRVDFPEGWKMKNARQAVTGSSEAKDAVVQASGGLAFELLRGTLVQRIRERIDAVG